MNDVITVLSYMLKVVNSHMFLAGDVGSLGYWLRVIVAVYVAIGLTRRMSS